MGDWFIKGARADGLARIRGGVGSEISGLGGSQPGEGGRKLDAQGVDRCPWAVASSQMREKAVQDPPAERELEPSPSESEIDPSESTGPIRTRRFGPWIEGRERAGSAVAFERKSPGLKTACGRSGTDEFREVLDRVEVGHRRGGSRRSAPEAVERLLAELCRYGSWADDLETLVRVGPGELEGELDAIAELDLAAVRGTPESPGPGELLLFAAHWSYLVADLVREMAPTLAGGGAVVVLTDGALPLAAHSVAEAAAAAGLPGSRLHVLHGLPLAEVGSVLPSELAERCFVRGRLEHETELAASLRALERAGVRSAELDLPRARSSRIGERDDPETAARQILRCLDPWPFLGGQRPGFASRLRVHPRVFAALTEALLEGLEDRSRRKAPVPAFQTSYEREYSAAIRHALGQGATLIHGLENGRFRFEPVLVTNCEEHMGIVHDDRPRPLLRLSRDGAR